MHGLVEWIFCVKLLNLLYILIINVSTMDQKYSITILILYTFNSVVYSRKVG